MEPEDYGAAMETAENILNEESPLTRKETRAYSTAMRSVFARVEKLRSKGFSFVQICAACEKSGILPKNANPYCFRQAFRRERARLFAEGELAKLIMDGAGTAEKAAAPPSKTDTAAGTRFMKTMNRQNYPVAVRDSEDAEKEWFRKHTSTTVDTGLGKIIKNSDGSFDYD
jgi:hypothetical protein